MNNIDLADLITSMGKSVEDSVAVMQKEKSKVQLEEFECTLTLAADIDETTLKNQPSNLTPISGLKFLSVKPKKVSVRLADKMSKQPSHNLQPDLGTLTIRAIFTPNTED
jgi:hypothetical protein